MQYKIQTSFGERILEEEKGKLIDIGSPDEIEKQKLKRKEKIRQEQEVRKRWELDTINSQIQTIPDELIPPAYIKGEPYRIIDGKYISLVEADIILQERKVRKEKIKLKNLTLNV